MIFFEIITIFPKMVEAYVSEGLLNIAQKKNFIKINVHDLRKWSDPKDRHKSVDDRPFGGGAGMVLMVEPIDKALQEIRKENIQTYIIATSPSGQKLNQKMLHELKDKVLANEVNKSDKVEKIEKEKDVQIIFLCGHYEGFDERILEHFVDMEISIGDFVLSGGELPVLTIIDGITRLIPGVLGNDTSAVTESFETNLLDFPQYTRPANYKGWEIPDILLSGHHKEIDKWRQQKAYEKTSLKRPDLLR